MMESEQTHKLLRYDVINQTSINSSIDYAQDGLSSLTLETRKRNLVESTENSNEDVKRLCSTKLPSLTENENDSLSPSRKDFIVDFINKCSHVELVHISETIIPLLKRDFISNLPYEIAIMILKHLSPRDLLNCAQVSKTWNYISQDSLLWREIFLRFDPSNFSNLSINVKNYKYHFLRNRHIDCRWRLGSKWAPFVMPCHSNHVITCLELYENWAITASDDSSICIWDIQTSQLKVRLTEHIGGVWYILVIPPKCRSHSTSSFIDCSLDELAHYPLLISGSTDRTARVWCLDGKVWPCVHTLIGHESTVRCLAVNKALIEQVDGISISASPETVIQSYCQKSHLGRCDVNSKYWPPLSGSTNSRIGRIVVTGSRDCTLRMWDTHSGQCLLLLQGHRGAVRCVQFHGAYIVSGSYDWTIRIWCAWSGECLYVLCEHSNRVYTLLFDGIRVISGSLDTTIRVWLLPKQSSAGENLSDHNRPDDLVVREQEIHGRANGNSVLSSKLVLYGHQSLTSDMVLDSTGEYLVSSNADETIRIWNVNTGECVYILAGSTKHESAVTCVQVLPRFILSSSDDGTIKLWDRITGKFIREVLRLNSAGYGGVFWRCIATQKYLVCAAGSRNGAEKTKLVVFHFDDQITNNSDLCNKSEIHSLSNHIHDTRPQCSWLGKLIEHLPQRPSDFPQRLSIDDDFLSYGFISQP